MGRKLELPESLASILQGTSELKNAYLVGGCVRDWLLNRPGKDYDIEVFGVGYEELTGALSRWGKPDLVGRSFGVVKLTLRDGTTYDFSIPRRDSKVSPGHKGFAVHFDPDIRPAEAAARRDFTLNALMYDPRRDELLDFFGGERDLKNRTLRHTSPAFVEDPLRVLRGMQFAARFELTAAPETVQLSRQIKGAFHELAVERVRDEWFKWAARSRLPSAGLKFLAATEWIDHFPEIAGLRNTPQDPEWHPEGDVFVHTCHCCDALVQQPEWQNADETTRIVLSLGILAHDFGKATTTTESVRDGQRRIISPGHEEAGVALAETFCQKIGTPKAIVDRILPLIGNHMAHLMTVTDRSVRRLAKRLEPENIEHLLLIMRADSMGRPPKPFRLPPSVHALESKAKELQVQSRAPKPLLMGRDLFQFGIEPGPEFKVLLDEAYEAQLEGRFHNHEEALRWLKTEKRLTAKSPSAPSADAPSPPDLD